MEGITREFEILKHLGSKVTKKNAEFKLSEEQRSIEELEHYIVTSFPAQISLMVEGIRNLDKYMEKSQAITKFTWKRFVIELNKALRAIKKEIRTVKGKARKEGTRGSFLIDYVFAFLGAYKMQLFLQLKASGLTELTTSNVWGGRDAA